MKINAISFDSYLIVINEPEINFELLQTKLNSLLEFDDRDINLVLEFVTKQALNKSKVSEMITYLEDYSQNNSKVTLLGIRNNKAVNDLEFSYPKLQLDSKIKLTHEKTLVLDKMVRSGQVFSNNGDILVMNNVSQGAEIRATGNIYVYGKNQGKLYAGCTGDKTSYIFMHRFNGEIISISDVYKLVDVYANNNLINKSVKIYVNELNRIMVDELK